MALLLEDIAPTLEALGCACALVAPDGEILLANSALALLVGRSSRALERLRLPELFAEPADRRFVEARLASALSPGDTTTREHFLPHSDGHPIHVLVTVKGVAIGSQVYRLITWIDISPLKEAQAAAERHLASVTELSDTAMEQAIGLKHYSEQLEDRVRARTFEVMSQNARLLAHAEQLETARVHALQMLAVACEAKDETTGAHVVRIGQGTSRVAEKLGLKPSEALALGQAAVLHDVGKLHVPDSILTKPGKLDEAEWIEMRQHTTWGERILAGGGEEFASAGVIARHHHENVDGTGYPDRLAGDSIPLPARIVRVVDSIDALASDRPYKKAWDWPQIIDHLTENQGKAFDREVVAAALDLINRREWPSPTGESGGGDATELGLDNPSAGTDARG